MKDAFYIIGTSHPIQCGKSEHSHAFEAEVEIVCKKLKIRRIAEEMSPEGLKRYGVTETVAQRVAKKLYIPCHHVDLSLCEREIVSLGDSVVLNAVMNFPFADGGGSFRKAFNELADEVRERCWSARVIAEKEWPVLFICGANHTASVWALWQRLGIDAVVVHADYHL
ncbi:hypothetical protein [Methylomicrobium lacus]|uniref:hypothetical protein n=1 Tax=Methylomicrobium lacus TaxID=136992 RepID=UPI0035A95AF9